MTENFPNSAGNELTTTGPEPLVIPTPPDGTDTKEFGGLLGDKTALKLNVAAVPVAICTGGLKTRLTVEVLDSDAVARFPPDVSVTWESIFGWLSATTIELTDSVLEPLLVSVIVPPSTD